MKEEKKEETYVLYAVADNKDLSKAKWYRTYGNKRSSGWVKDFNDAKIWSKRGSAKGKATNLGPTAYLVEFVVAKVKVIDQTEHIKKVAEERRQKELRQQRAAHEAAIKRAKEDMARAQEKLRKLTHTTCTHCKGTGIVRREDDYGDLRDYQCFQCRGDGLVLRKV